MILRFNFFLHCISYYTCTFLLCNTKYYTIIPNQYILYKDFYVQLICVCIRNGFGIFEIIIYVKKNVNIMPFFFIKCNVYLFTRPLQLFHFDGRINMFTLVSIPWRLHGQTYHVQIYNT